MVLKRLLLCVVDGGDFKSFGEGGNAGKERIEEQVRLKEGKLSEPNTLGVIRSICIKPKGVKIYKRCHVLSCEDLSPR